LFLNGRGKDTPGFRSAGQVLSKVEAGVLPMQTYFESIPNASRKSTSKL
jgi:hypothetical protein